MPGVDLRDPRYDGLGERICPIPQETHIPPPKRRYKAHFLAKSTAARHASVNRRLRAWAAQGPEGPE
jgi:hypothetical protein